MTASRGALVSLIFSKTLSLSATATANVDTTAALSLMSTDVEGICMALTTIHDLWSCIMEAAIAIYLLQRQIGLACIVPIIVAAGKPSLLFSCMASRLIHLQSLYSCHIIPFKVESSSPCRLECRDTRSGQSDVWHS